MQDKRVSEYIAYWRCEKQDELKCKGRLKIDGDVIISESRNHCHALDPTSVEVVAALDFPMMNRRAEAIQESFHLILTTATNSRSGTAAANLPSQRTLARGIQRF